jgi:hypothetical protein
MVTSVDVPTELGVFLGADQLLAVEAGDVTGITELFAPNIFVAFTSNGTTLVLFLGSVLSLPPLRWGIILCSSNWRVGNSGNIAR